MTKAQDKAIQRAKTQSLGSRQMKMLKEEQYKAWFYDIMLNCFVLANRNEISEGESCEFVEYLWNLGDKMRIQKYYYCCFNDILFVSELIKHEGIFHETVLNDFIFATYDKDVQTEILKDILYKINKLYEEFNKKILVNLHKYLSAKRS